MFSDSFNHKQETNYCITYQVKILIMPRIKKQSQLFSLPQQEKVKNLPSEAYFFCLSTNKRNSMQQKLLFTIFKQQKLISYVEQEKNTFICDQLSTHSTEL